MGAEEFCVRIRVPSSPDATVNWLHTLATSVDAGPAGLSRVWVISGRFSIVESQLRSAGAETEVEFRIAVCHPTSGLEEFADLIVKATGALGASAVSIREDLPPEIQADFTTGEFSKLRRSVSEGVEHKRGLWKSDFGPDEAMVRPDEALRRFVMRT